MKLKKIYSLFPHIPSGHAEDDRREWSKERAEEYYKLLMESIVTRTDGLLKYFNESISDANKDILLRLGDKAVIEIETNKLWAIAEEKLIKFKSGHVIKIDKEKELTDAGYSIAADMGLLVARFLIDDCSGSVRWNLIRKPKNDASYNSAVLVGCGVPWDPVESSVANTYGILRGDLSSDIWRKMYFEAYEAFEKGNTES